MKKISIIDDDKVILETLSAALFIEGYKVKTFNCTKSFFKSIKERPDLIILDLLIAKEDGRKVAHRLKKLDGIKEVPIIMISAHPSGEDAARMAGADEFLAKPFELSNLLRVIERLEKMP